jgi:hypothetical protein
VRGAHPLQPLGVGGTGYKVLHSFTSSQGALPEGFIINGSTIYGATQSGGANRTGALFQMNTNGTGFQTIYQFPAYNGQTLETPFGKPALVGSTLYGETSGGFYYGAIYSVNTDGTGFNALYNVNPRASEKSRCSMRVMMPRS